MGCNCLIFGRSRGVFLGLGIALSVVGVAAVWAVMRYGYQLPVSLSLLAIGCAYVAQMFFALPLIYGLYKVGSESSVLRVNLAVVTLNAAGNLALIPLFGIEGALLSSFVVQAGAATWYYVAVRRKALDGDATALTFSVPGSRP